MLKALPPILLYGVPEVWASKISTAIRTPAIFRLLLGDAYVSFPINRVDVHINRVTKGGIGHDKSASVQPCVLKMNASELMS